jgi:F-type H+-transporting ATPase subunit b
MSLAPNWAQLLTTVVGFLLLVWIMRKYAWGPIIDLIDQRREKIEADYEAAERELGSAEQLKADFETKLGDIKVIERERVQEAVHKGEQLAEGIVTRARTEVDQTRAKSMQDLELETRKAQKQLRDDVVHLAIGAAEKLIDERLDEAKHRQLIERYIDELALDGQGK